MELAKIEVTRADARKIYCGTLTSGMVGAEVSFSFDAAWDGLKRIATFKAGGTSKDVLLTENRCEIPHEVLARPVHLVVGVYGTTADGRLVIPTVWAELGRVENGTKPSGESSKKPTPEVWAQILGMIGDLEDLNTEAKESLVAAINEVLLKGADPEEIQRIVEEYLGENSSGGIHVGPYPPDDPNVDIWLDTSEEKTSPYIPNTTAKPGQIVRVVAVDGNGMVTAVEAVNMPSGGNYELPAATADTLGGIKADPAADGDTQPVRVGEDGKLYTAPGSGGGEVWETIIDYTVPEDCVQVFLKTDINGNPFKLKEAVLLMVLHPLESGGTPTPVRCTVDGTVNGSVGSVYGASHYVHGFPSTPSEGNYSYVRMNLVSTPNGVWLREYVYNNNGTADANGLTGGRTQGIHENIHIDTLQSPVKEISAVGLGSYSVAVGKGTRIVMVGVRE